jgi:hypothetical protein
MQNMQPKLHFTGTIVLHILFIIIYLHITYIIPVKCNLCWMLGYISLVLLCE